MLKSFIKRGKSKYRSWFLLLREKLPFAARLRSLLKLMGIAAITVVLAIAALYFYLSTQSLPAASISQTSRMLDLQGNVIDTFHAGENRYSVSLDQISPYVIQATLAIEDRRFYDHIGFDIKGMARALVVNVQSMSTKQGASTLTQQLARNLYLTHERTWQRKVKEAVYTAQLEMKYSKDEILAMYLNQIYYGHGCYGIEAAAKHYFSKRAIDLSLAESAMLAGIPKGPKYYSPFHNMKAAKDRQYLILEAMIQEGSITQQEADDAYKEVLAFEPSRSSQDNGIAPYFRDYVRQIAVDELGIEEQLINEGGISIYTTLDPTMQEAAENTIRDKMPQSSEQQAALIAIDPRNGYIKAMVGGRSYADNQYNRVLASTRQPGSTFKPFLYLTALQSGFMSPTTHFMSEPTFFTYDEGRKKYEPRNFGDKYVFDYIDMRKAIASSDNIYAVNTIMTLGAEKVIETARKLGITSPMSPMPSLALGTYPISPLEMASAFGTFSNGGAHYKPVAILRIEDRKGHILYEAQPQFEQVITPAEAYVMTSLLESVFKEGGTGYRVAAAIKRPVAGKTGTTAADAWMVGYTPELATAVWVGYDKDHKLTVAEAQRAAPIFAQFTEQALAAVPPKIFPIPEGVVTVYIEPKTGRLAAASCPDKRLETFLTGTEPSLTDICGSDAPVDDAAGSKSGNQEQAKKEKGRSWWGGLKRWRTN